MRQSRRLLAISMLLGLCVAIVLVRYPQGEDTHETGFSNQSILCSHDTETFDVTYESGGASHATLMELSGLDQGNSSIKAHGSLAVRCTDRHIWVKLHSFTIESQSGLLAQIGDLNLLKVEIDREDTGIIRSMHFEDSVSQIQIYLVRDMLSHFSIKSQKGSTWTAEEDDSHGRYLSDYTYADNTLTKTRQRYGTETKAFVKQSDQRQIRIDQGTSQYTFAAGGLDKIDSKVSLQFYLADKLLADSYSRLRAAKSKKTHQLQVEKPVTTKSVALSQEDDQKRLEEIMERRQLQDDTFETIMASLESAKDEQFTAVFLKLKALVKLNPKEALRLSDYLLEQDFESSKFHLVSGVLSHVGSPEAQEALVVALNGHQDAKSQIALIGDLGVTEYPTIASENAIRDHREQSSNADIKQVSNLALGNMARSLSKREPQRYQRIKKESLASLIACDSYVDCINALHVLGNLGAPETLDIAKKFLQAKDPATRSVAVSALRFVDLYAVEDILLDIAQTDPEDEVRKAAAHELSFRVLRDTSTNQILARMSQESSEGVRLKLLASVASQVKTKPEWQSSVALIAQSDIAQSVRDMAENLTR